MKIIIEDDEGVIEFEDVTSYVLVVEHSGDKSELIAYADQVYIGFASQLTQKAFRKFVDEEKESQLS